MRFKLLVFLLCLLLVIPGPAQAKGEQPTYTVGDFWNYAYSATSVDGTLRTTVTGTRQVDVGGTTYTVWTGNVTGSGTYDDGTYAGPLTMRGHTYLDKATLGTVEESLVYEGTITPKGGGASHTLRISGFQTYDPPLQLQRFPLAPGNLWNANAAVHEVLESTIDGNPVPGYPVDRNFTTQSVFSVGAKDNRTVRAGTFEVFIVKNTTVEFWYADAVGNAIKTIDNRGSEPTIFELIEYSYQGPPRIEAPASPTVQPAPGFLPGPDALLAVAVVSMAALAVRHRRP